MSAPYVPKVYVVLVNWNGWRDTVECLESLFASDHPRFEAVVCDNGSTDGSIEQLHDWAEGRLAWTVPPSSPARSWQAAPLPKPLACRVLRHGAAAGSADATPQVTIIAVGKNRGFAAGVNAGLQYAASRGDLAFAWMLNNDTVVAPDAMSSLVSAVVDPDAPVLCGGTLLDYDAPDTVQAFAGGRFLAAAGLPRLIGAGVPAGSPSPAPAEIERQLAYVSGASMFAARGFLDAAGPLDESYFLYFEELDWVRRAGRRARLRYAPAARIFHKAGATIGTGTRVRRPSPFAEYHFQRSRIRFTRRYHAYALPGVAGLMLLQGARRLLRGEPELARAVFRALFARPFDPSARAAERAPV